MIKIIFGDSFVVCCCDVLTQTGEDNGDQTDHAMGMDDTLNRQWQKRKAEEAVTVWHTDKTPCLVCGEGVLWYTQYTWHPLICCLRCISLWCALVHYNSLWEVTPSHVDIPRTFWRKMENEPNMSRFRPNSLKTQPQRKFCKFMRHLLIFSDSLWFLWCSFTSRVLLVMYPFLPQY